jgi:outer membrane protein assembly factor BamB
MCGPLLKERATGLAGATMALLVVATAQAESGHWPAFRGAAASGIADGAPLAVSFHVDPQQNVAWKTAIPGLAHASPVVWDGRVYALTAVAAGEDESLKVGLYGDIGSVNDERPQTWDLLALDAASGALIWRRTLYRGVPKIKRHPKATHANTTPAVDGKRIVVLLGSEGLYCLDLDGNLQWEKDLGVLDSGFFMVPGAQWGFASSPVLHEDKVIVQADVQKGSFLAALAAADGRELWRRERDEVPTWSTPTVIRVGDRQQIVVNGFKRMAAYDFDTGEELWWMQGGGDIPVPTPVSAWGLTFITNAHGRSAPIFAVRHEARGEITLADGQSSSEHIAWSKPRAGNYMQTPILYGDLAYFCNDRGVLSVYVGTTGDLLYQQRLGSGSSGFTASPVAGDGKLYFTSEEGEVHVVKAGRTFELLGTSALGETCLSTPAIASGTLFFRTRHHLIAIRDQGSTASGTAPPSGSSASSAPGSSSASIAVSGSSSAP